MTVAGATFVIIGGLEAFPRRLAARTIAEKGGELRRGLSRRTTFAVFGRRLLAGATIPARLAARIDEAVGAGALPLSENGFLQLLGLAAPAAMPRDLSAKQLRDQSGLDARAFEYLLLFDAFETPMEPFGFRDLVAARQYARLVGEGVSWLDIVRAARSRQLAAPESGVSGARLTRAGSDILMQSGEALAELSGQLLLGLPAESDPVDSLFDAAIEAEEAEDWERAAQLYRRCVEVEPADPDIAFNLSHALMKKGDWREARLYLNKVLKRDPKYAEAWYNLAAIARAQNEPDSARRHLRQAIAADPGYPDPLYNLALLEFDSGNYAKAGELWRRYAELDPDSPWGRKARYGLQLIAMMEDGGQPAGAPVPDRRVVR